MKAPVGHAIGQTELGLDQVTAADGRRYVLPEAAHSALHQVYPSNVGVKPVLDQAFRLRLDADRTLDCRVAPLTEDVTWNVAWDHSHSSVMFAPTVAAGAQIGYNLNFFGRYDGATPAPENAVTLRDQEHGKFVVGPEGGLIPALRLQRRNFESAAISRTTEGLPASSLDLDLPLAEFVFRSTYLDRGGQDSILERRLMVYPTFCLLAERTMNPGPPNCCPANDWEDRLLVLAGEIGPQQLEQAPLPGSPLRGSSFTTYPEVILGTVDDYRESRSPARQAAFYRALDNFRAFNQTS